MKQNSYPMKEWHVEHMKNTLLKFVTGLTENASRREVRINNKYGKIGSVSKRIDYDIKHGDGSMERLDEIHAIFHAR